MLQYSLINKLKQPPALRVLPITTAITFLGFLDTHLHIPIIAFYAHELGASVSIIILTLVIALTAFRRI
jgi:hypothetical protein